MSTVSPARSCATPRRSSVAATICSGSASRPAPTMPHARYPLPGSMTCTPRISRVISAAGIDDVHAATAQEFQVRVGGRMLPHVDVHGGSDDHGSRGGGIEGAEKIVGDALCELGQYVGGGGSDQESIDGLRNRYVLDCGIEVGLLRGGAEHAGDDLLAGQGRESQRADELLRRGGHDDLHMHAALLQLANDLGGLVGGDAAAHTQCDFHVCA